EDEQRPGVPLDVVPGEVQERRREDLRQPAKVTGQDAVAVVEPVVAGPVGDLEHPDQADKADHQEERLPGLGYIDPSGADHRVPASPGWTGHVPIVYQSRRDALISAGLPVTVGAHLGARAADLHRAPP